MGSRTDYGTLIKTLLDVFATDSADKTPIENVPEGYSTVYTGSVFPDRRHLNDVLCKLASIGLDVNRFGSLLPWNASLSYEEGAHVIGSDLRIYRSAVAANEGFDPTGIGNVPSKWVDVQLETLGLVPTSGLLVDQFMLKSSSVGGRTTIPTAISGVVSNAGDFGHSGNRIGSFNLTGSINLSSLKDYLIDIQSMFDSAGSNYVSVYSIKPSDCSESPVVIRSNVDKSGGAGHGYAFTPLCGAAMFKYRPVSDGPLTLNFVHSGGNAMMVSSMVKVFEI